MGSLIIDYTHRVHLYIYTHTRIYSLVYSKDQVLMAHDSGTMVIVRFNIRVECVYMRNAGN